VKELVRSEFHDSRMSTLNSVCQNAPKPVAIPSHEIQVWSASLDRPLCLIHEFEGTLSDDERQRANRFRFDIHKRRFVVGRGLLRAILADYLEIRPCEVRFAYGLHGKPMLHQNEFENSVHFNVSHSGSHALYAISRDCEVGVDLEYVRPLTDVEQIAEHFFSSTEFSAFQTVPAFQRLTAFYNCWTRKEAFIKAIGNGLTQPLDSFVVSFNPGQSASLLSIEGDKRKARDWTIDELIIENQYIAALAYRGQGHKLTCFRF
jgi:4'-phosphopantetheinyl transferase